LQKNVKKTKMKKIQIPKSFDKHVPPWVEAGIIFKGGGKHGNHPLGGPTMAISCKNSF
jgi:hypothetical protein